MGEIKNLIEKLGKLNYENMHNNDFFWTWDKSDDELQAVFTVADILRKMREENISTKVFDSGLGISVFRDNSTRTRFSFASACNLLGLEVQDLDEGKSQIAHGETVRETANMISFMADVIGIRDDMFIGKGHAYQKEVSEAVQSGYKDGVLEQRPTIVNLQCDVDHPTQSMADMAHLIHYFGGVENLKGKPNSNYHFLVTSNISKDGKILFDDEDKIAPRNDRWRILYAGEEGDVLLASKGLAIKSAVIEKESPNSIISGNLICIRLLKDRYYPEF
jgi:hypothetical protein